MKYYVYRYYDADGAPLYIGCTRNLPSRKQQHRRMPWFLNVRSWKLDEYPTQRAALDAERAAIEAEAPLHNVQYNPRAAEVAA